MPSAENSSTSQCQTNSKIQRYIGMKAGGVTFYFQTLRSQLGQELARIVQLFLVEVATEHLRLQN